MNFVLDCSVAMSFYFAEEESDYGNAVLQKLEQGAVAVVPTLFFCEVANVLHVAYRKNRTTLKDINAFLEALTLLPIQQDVAPVQPKTIIEHCRKHNVSAYDAMYLATSIKYDVPIATLDEKLKQAAKGEKKYLDISI